jgi:hypothetical protein
LAPVRSAGYDPQMLIAALLVGLLTAYYFGLRPGMAAAGATAGLFLVAMVAPHLAIFAYGAVGVGVGVVCIVGPKLRRKGTPAQVTFAARVGVAEVMRRYRKLKRASRENRRPPARRS